MYQFSEPFRDPTGSPIRELFKYLGEPGMISVAGGYPASDLFDLDGLQHAAANAWSQPARCLQYGPTDGLPELKDEIARIMRQRGVSVTSTETMVTTGSQQGFDLLLRVMIEPGDVVLTEQPAYPATLQALRMQRARVVTIPVDEDGLDVARLTAMLESGAAGRPKLLYTVPTFANPTGATLTRERRAALLDLAIRFDFLIVEDEPYADLRFAGEFVPSLLSLAEQMDGARERLVYLGSLSKIVAPGLRIGWLVAPSDIVRRCVVAKQTADLCSAPWLQAIGAAYLAEGALQRHLPRITGVYQRKCAALCDALDAQLGSVVQFQRPEGGMFVWARMDGIDASALLAQAIHERVLFVPGTAFYADRVDASTFRLSFAAPGVDEFGEAVSRLARARQSIQNGASPR
ncbi:aminotransferase-like domain-containing protein [Chitinasiproducens palmae]|uniref:DNA-binding transcriptional regulator, MocR family, contains an aminotransferase domain n=1 Tax=Chitinasiproducens palmae TaxID=1770053 RepID=A0A1H2PQ85_9BURK|nr:PLP-dependent aminotransferase family protein [Chitinasiproducens palmae]SDV48983.1 DNA-binding transcriptional regulator, MocR family, contains an aminotransferase domain [Chitinasiproducens palmae]